MGHALNGTSRTPDPLPPHARLQRALAAGVRPRLDCAADRHRVGLLAAEGNRDYEDLGREDSWRALWELSAEYGPQSLGSSGRSVRRSTIAGTASPLTTEYTRAVMRFFVPFSGQGCIYRGNRIVNWCRGCASVISDLEVDHIDVDDALTYARYPFADGDGTSRRDRAPGDDARRCRGGGASDDGRYRDASGAR